MRPYFTPRYRWQLIEALKARWPKGSFSGMSKQQLLAVFHRLRAEQFNNRGVGYGNQTLSGL